MIRIILLCCLTVLIAGCSLPRSEQAEKPIDKPIDIPDVEDKERLAVARQKEALERKQRAERRLTAELDRLIAAEDYLRALQKTDTFSADHGMPRSLIERYLTALNGLLDQAEQMKRDGHVMQAGILFHFARKYFPPQADLQDSVHLPRGKIDKNIADCVDRVLELGFLEYRAGRFERAVEIWRGIEKFDPGNIDSKKAIETTLLQMKSLEEMNLEMTAKPAGDQ